MFFIIKKPSFCSLFVDHTLKIQWGQLLSSIRNLLLDFNLFKSSSQDVNALHRQRITTRVFIICVAITLAIASLYAFLSTQTKIFNLPSPSRTDYERLLELYSDSVQCSCAQLGISYSDFIEIVPTFHQLCSSEIILPEWYNRLAQFNGSSSFTASDRRFQVTFGANYFQILATFCTLANNTVVNAYRVFSVRTFINNHILPEAIFSKQVKSLTDTFTLSTKNEFNRILSLARSAIQINQLASRTFSNFITSYNPTTKQMNMLESQLQRNPAIYPVIGDTCSCLSEGIMCGALTYLYEVYDYAERRYLENLILKCLPTESALASTLECWYDENCSSAVIVAYGTEGISISNGTLPLSFNTFSRFPKNVTMEVMMNELLIENWTIHVSYDKFFNKCAPVSCVYAIQERFDLFFVIITIIGIYKSLNDGFRLILPLIVRLALIFLRRIRMRGSLVNQSTTINEGIRGRGIF